MLFKLKAKYFKTSDFWNAELSNGAYVSWGSIVKGRNVVRKCLRWNVGDARLHNSVPENIVTEVLAMPVCNLSNNPDMLIWSASNSGSISVKDAYTFLNKKFNGEFIINKDWSFLWKLKCPFKYKFFLWQLCQNRVNVNESLYMKGLCNHPGCTLYNNDFETTFHLFFGCAKVLEKVRFNANWVLATALRTDNEYYQVNSISSTGGRNMEEIHVARQVPNAGYYNINTNGSTIDCGDAGIGGIIRDGAGGFVACFCKHICKNNNNVAEVWAIRDGLILADQLGANCLEVESDSCYAIQLCKGESKPHWDTYKLVQYINMLKNKFDQVIFKQKYREANQVADRLTKNGATREVEGIWTTNMPSFINSVFNNM
ncbi:uncharacterized protein LOC113312946 [Papaver somniferum]|uniref:uncharacterized protein LOC113312946 n=1 Tax=Papaver somniferum TaxID=3469 RepID=UPI000E6FC25F|nr:uncharacterized protein LOC113312946 [Papaver somniferum]